jgi:F-type H+-transporting ATPase subunit delta
MTTEATNGYVEAVLALAHAHGVSEVVETELRSFAELLGSATELREKAIDERIPVGQRLAIVEANLLRPAHHVTRTVIAMLITAGALSDVSAIAAEVTRRVAATRQEEVAEVTVAVALDAERTQALKAALEAITGRSLDVRVTVDERVLGGVQARIGDTVIDGSLASRLNQLRTRVGA